MKQGLVLPYPSGPHWNNLVSNKAAKKSYAHGLHEDDVEEEQAYYTRLAFEKTCSYEPPEGELLKNEHGRSWNSLCGISLRSGSPF